MLKITTQAREYYAEDIAEFVTIPGVSLTLEHSLSTISKWESRWLKPFMSTSNKTDVEMLDYILCMDTTGTLTMETLQNFDQTDIDRIFKYIESSMTATTFSEVNGGTSREIVTSELIYYWMIALQIPLECEHWHLNRLMTLIRICNIKNSPPKKQNKQTMMNRNRELNKQRRAQANSTG